MAFVILQEGRPQKCIVFALNLKSVIVTNACDQEKKINQWKEDKVTNKTSGIKRENIPQFIEALKRYTNFPSAYLSAEFAHALQQIVNECNHMGMMSTIYGNLDQKTAMYSLFHCSLEEPDDTFTVAFIIFTLSTEFESENVQPGLEVERGFKKEVQLGREVMASYVATSAVKDLASLGIDMPLYPDRGANTGSAVDQQVFYQLSSSNLLVLGDLLILKNLLLYIVTHKFAVHRKVTVRIGYNDCSK